MDPILQQLLAADPVLAQQAGLPQPPVPSVTRPEPVDPALAAMAASLGDVPRDPTGLPVDQALANQPPVSTPDPGNPGAVGGAASRSSGVSVGQNGWSQEKSDQILGSRDTRQAAAQTQSLGGAIGQNLNAYATGLQGTRDRGQAVIARQGELAAQRAGDEAAAAQKQAAEGMEAARGIQTLTDAAWTKVAQSQADFQAQLAAVRGMRVNPTQWYTDRDTGQKVADGLSAGVAMYWMASGKPAMAEIGKTILGNFDKQIERNINAQVENLRNQQQVSDGFLRAWQLASQNATSEVEAKARVQAMLLQAHKDQLAADIAAKYGSDTARAGFEQAAVEFDRKIQDQLYKATQEAEKNYLDIAKMETQKYLGRLQAGMEGKRLALEQAKFDAAKNAPRESGPAALAKLGYFGVVNPETGDLSYFTDSADKQAKANEVLDNGRKLQKTLADLRAAIRDAGGANVVGGIRSWAELKNSKDLKIAGLATVAAYQLAKTVDPQGRAVTDSDFDNMVPVTGILGLAAIDDGTESRKQIANLLGDYTQGGVRQLAYDITPDIRSVFQAYGMDRPGAQKPALEGNLADVNAKAPETTRLDKATKVFNDPSDREQTYVRPGDDGADRQWLAYASETGAKLDGFPARDPSLNAVRQPGWAPEMSDLAMIMRDPSLPQADRVRARERLLQIQKLQTTGDPAKDKEDPGNVDAAYFAKWLLSQ